MKMKKSSVIYRTLFHLFYLCAKGAKGEYHKLEALKSERDSYNRDTANEACEEISDSKLPTGEYYPKQICYRMSLEMGDHGLSEGCEREPCRLEALRSKRNADYGY